MCDANKTINKTKTEELHIAAGNVEEAVAAAPVQAEQPVAVQEVRQQEITEVLPMRQELAPIPSIPQVLQRRAEPIQQPVQEEQTFKQRWKQQREDKRMKDKNGEHADHVSSDIKRQMDKLNLERNAADPKIAEVMNEAMQNRGIEVDGRVLKSFIQGYKVNWRGKPLNRQEEEKKQRDERFLEDYASCDLQRRLPYLEQMKNEVLNYRISPDMLSEAYLEKHAAEVYDICTRMTYFENVMKDTINAPFFENLPEVEKKLLKYRVQDLCGYFSNSWICVLASKSLTISGSVAEFVDDEYFYETLAGNGKMEEMKNKLKNQLEKSEEKEEELRQEVLMQARQQGITTFNEAVADSLPAPALDKEIGTEADYESLKSLFYEEMQNDVHDGQTVQVKGLIELSNHVLERQGESGALQAFQIRESAKEAAKRDKKLRGQFFLDIPKDYVQMFRKLQDAGVDFAKMSSGFKRVSCGMGAYVSGGGIGQIHDKMFINFQKYIEAPQGQDYVQKMISILENAKVFEGNREKCVNYILQCLLNSYGANYVDVAADGDYYGEQAEAAKKVCMESCRNLLSLPRIVQMPEEEKAKLPKEIADLEKQYRQLIQRMSRK